VYATALPQPRGEYFSSKWLSGDWLFLLNFSFFIFLLGEREARSPGSDFALEARQCVACGGHVCCGR
jgi:hypothetical protein